MIFFQPQIHNSPIPVIDKILYDLNATIQQESRKNSDLENTSKRIIKEFKNANKSIIEKLKSENNVYNSRSNLSTDTLNDTVRPNSSKSIPKRDVTQTNTNKLINNDSSNSTTGYSNSIQEDQSNICAHSVKHSTELLTTIENNKDFNSSEEMLNQNEISDSETNRHDRLMINDNYFNLKIITDINNNDSNVARNEASQFNDCDGIDDRSDSDIATALTQILEETETSVLSEQVSVDEELMRETIEEINNDLKKNNVIVLDDIILTPPLGFRDNDM